MGVNTSILSKPFPTLNLLILGLVIMNLDALVLLTVCLCAVSRSAAEEDDVTEMSTTTTTLTTEATTKLTTTTEATTKLATSTEATTKLATSTETTTEAAIKLLSMKTTPTVSTSESFEELKTATSKIIGVPEYITSSTVNELNVITNKTSTASDIVVIRNSESSVSTITNLPVNIDNVSTFVATTDSSTTSGDSITSTATPTLHFTTIKATEENLVVSTDSPNKVSSQTDGSLMGAPTDMSTDSFMKSSESPLSTKDNEVFTSSDIFLPFTEGNHVLTSGNPLMSTGSSSTGDFMVDSMSSSTESSYDTTSSVPVISTTDYMDTTSMHNLPSSPRASRNLNLNSPIYFTDPVESVDSTTEYQT